MRLAHIVPTPLLDEVLSAEDRTHLVVASQLKDDSYRRFYHNRGVRGDHIIVDSDVFETGQVANMYDLITAARTVHAKTLILPDAWGEDGGNARATIDLALNCGRTVRDALPHIKTIGVAHGRSWPEYAACVGALDALWSVDHIGLVEEAHLYGRTRAELIHDVAEITRKPLHLNGLSESFCEFSLPSETLDRVATCDASKVVVWGLNGFACLPNLVPSKYPGRKSLGGRVGYFDYHTDNREHIEHARHNIAAWREYLEG